MPCAADATTSTSRRRAATCSVSAARANRRHGDSSAPHGSGSPAAGASPADRVAVTRIASTTSRRTTCAARWRDHCAGCGQTTSTCTSCTARRWSPRPSSRSSTTCARRARWASSASEPRASSRPSNGSPCRRWRACRSRSGSSTRTPPTRCSRCFGSGPRRCGHAACSVAGCWPWPLAIQQRWPTIPKPRSLPPSPRSAADAGVGVDELAINFARSFPAVSVVLLGVSSSAHLRRNVAVITASPLRADVREAVLLLTDRHQRGRS